tara:strand:+ start:4585 stop:4827 length:243 start_codon:yes stop_codon:yes gene_type:complete
MSYHQFRNETGEAFGSFEVFWDDSDTGPWSDEPRNFDHDDEPVKPGFYWWACFPGCLPDASPSGPFQNEQEAIKDATDYI